MLLFYETRTRSEDIPEGKLDEFLASLHKTREDLVVDEKSMRAYDEAAIVKTMKLTPYIPINGVEIWHIRSFNKGLRKYDGFKYRLPGFSIMEFVNRRRFTYDYLDFTLEEVENSFRKLQKLGLIVESMKFRGESRFVIADERLRAMVKEIGFIEQIQWNNMLTSWDYVRSPTNEERDWLRKFYGRNQADKLLDEKALSRREFLKRKDDDISKVIFKKHIKEQEKEIKDRIKKLKETYGDILNEYDFLREIIKIVCPKIFEAA
ncbi:hypothetical protein [Nitrososphaera viennensis]|uniref:Uncharacterized protein n=1 Tax=Nitrososphaera viennensis TaxID=1034015 RepID=A0A977ICE5_9ARCH|nr:hypothetical protein [Nitrososphaera viennensis]UVS68424.1 hypothetical protein NWT39_11000 [Nitrososphaera viennensis]